jgi:2-keto-myo-inositol isomerase
MTAPFGRLALHTWTVDTTPLDVALAAARDGGFDAVELRRIDFKRCYDKGMSNGEVLDLIRAAEIPVCTLGCEYGWLFATGDESKRLFDVLRQTCENAVALECPQIMCAPGPSAGPKSDAIENLKRGGDMVGELGLTLAIEFNSQHDVINSIATLREVVHGAARKNVGMLLDAYHLERSGAGGRSFADVSPEDIAAFQYSDAPPAPVTAGVRRPTDRLPPGQGIVRWIEVLQLLFEKRYTGHLSYEAPNPELWARSPFEVAREGVQATRALIARALTNVVPGAMARAKH